MLLAKTETAVVVVLVFAGSGIVNPQGIVPVSLEQAPTRLVGDQGNGQLFAGEANRNGLGTDRDGSRRP